MSTIKKLLFFGILIVFFILNFNSAVYSQSEKQQIIITIDCLQTEELWDFSCWQKFEKKIAWGLMSPYTPAPFRDLNSYLTLGLGFPVSAPAGERGLAFQSNESIHGLLISEIFAERMSSVADKNQICLIDFNEIAEGIKAQHPIACFGALGDALEKAGLTRVVLGNSDLWQQNRRNSPYILTDSRGRVDFGEVGSAFNESQAFAAAYYETDYIKLLNLFLEYQDHDILLLEIGDISKLESSQKLFSPAMFNQLRQEYLSKIDVFLGQILEQINFERTRLIVLVANKSSLDAVRGLLPIAVLSKENGGGLLISPTTKRAGLVANIDLAPTILSYWDLAIPYFMSGRAIGAQNFPLNSLEQLRLINGTTNFINAARPLILKTFIFSETIVISFFLLLFCSKRKASNRIYPWIFVFISLLPLLFLIMGCFKITRLRDYLGLGLICFFLLLSVNLFFSKLLKNDLMAIISLTTSLMIMIDLALGSPLMKNSVLGYDPVRGARFYGLGNEYMGVLIGATIIGLAFYLQDLAARQSLDHKTIYIFPLVFAFLLVLFFLASPKLGTNVGGTIAGSIAFTLTIVKLADYKINYQMILLVFIAVCILLGILFLIDDRADLNNQTHLGLLVSGIKNQGWQSLFIVFQRKISINLKLIRSTNWSLLFLVSFMSLVFAFYKPSGMIREICRNYTYLSSGFMGTLLGSLVALIVNDSGIVAAATMMIFPVNVLFYLALNRRRGYQ